MKFEFDPAKSAANELKHGIDFVKGQALWEDENAIEVAAKVGDEPRFLRIGMALEKLWSCIYTLRGDSIRLISIRRARTNERKLYE